jgi:hypothetical protein
MQQADSTGQADSTFVLSASACRKSSAKAGLLVIFMV